MRYLVTLFLLTSFVSCVDAEEEKNIKEAVPAEKAEPKHQSKPDQAVKVENIAEQKSETLEVMNGPNEKIMTPAIPTEVIAAAELERNQSKENPVSQPEVFIIKEGELSRAAKPNAGTTDETVSESKNLEKENDQVLDFIVKATHLNVRSGPSMQFPVVRVVTQGAKFRSLSVEGIWVQMAKDQYVSKHFLKLDSEEYADKN